MAVTKAMKPAQRAGEPMESMGTKVSERGGLGVGFRGCTGERLWTCAGCNRRPKKVVPAGLQLVRKTTQLATGSACLTGSVAGR